MSVMWCSERDVGKIRRRWQVEKQKQRDPGSFNTAVDDDDCWVAAGHRGKALVEGIAAGQAG